MSRVTEDRPLPQATALRVVRELDEEAWTEFVDHHPHGSIFHTPQMHRVLEQTRHHRPSVWAALAGEEIRALMTVVEIATLGGALRPLTSRSVAFATPLAVDGDEGDTVLEALLVACRRSSSRVSLFTEIRNHVDASAMRSRLSHTGFRHERHLNFLVDLTPPEDELWSRVWSSARRAIKKARKMGVTIDVAADRSEVAGAYEILRDVYHRIQVPLPDRSLFDASLEILGPLGNSGSWSPGSRGVRSESCPCSSTRTSSTTGTRARCGSTPGIVQVPPRMAGDHRREGERLHDPRLRRGRPAGRALRCTGLRSGIRRPARGLSVAMFGRLLP